ncbi:peptidase C14 [Laetiporus sulphureus 93-53]|uniref:Peptidase C14 n=1 Tax=Laetiporus sulphureus 93-53 TaxID=1314785 RepID=A0A165D1D2_9APHY|nr:peptidase C14 [Laetiporus sulphureus 93-53]KZT03948.1 peptidase C14 [Laetiporus sulphureus 93-53]
MLDSGHGGQVSATDGDEVDGMDEDIYPSDFNISGCIIDNDIHDILTRRLPKECRLTCVFDSCHSESVLDLPYTLTCSRSRPGHPMFHSEVSKEAWPAKAVEGDVICCSACTDEGISRETYGAAGASGLFTSALIKLIRSHPNYSWMDLICSARKELESSGQEPQLSVSHECDINCTIA